MGIGAWSWGDRSGYWGYGQGYGKRNMHNLVYCKIYMPLFLSQGWGPCHLEGTSDTAADYVAVFGAAAPRSDNARLNLLCIHPQRPPRVQAVIQCASPANTCHCHAGKDENREAYDAVISSDLDFIDTAEVCSWHPQHDI